MERRCIGLNFVRGVLAACVGLLPAAATRADETPAANAKIGALAGMWTVSYENGAVHSYTFDKDGNRCQTASSPTFRDRAGWITCGIRFCARTACMS